MDQDWRFATWNVDWWHRNKALLSRAQFIAAHKPDVVAMQEIRGWEARRLAEELGWNAAFAHDIWPTATDAWMGCVVLARPDITVVDAGVVDTLPKPQRSLWTRLRFPNGDGVTAVSWHTPNRAGDGLKVKMAAYEAMTRWLIEAPRPLVLGADLNSWRDPVDLAAPVAGEEQAAEFAFVGPGPAHHLVDGWRAVLDQTGALRELPLAGPLAVSKVLDGGVAHRMDRIFLSEELVALDGGYDLDGAANAGSDHALHWLDLRLSASP